VIRVNLLAPERPTTKKKASVGGGPAVPGALQAYVLLTLFVGGALLLCGFIWWYQTSKLKDLDRKIAADEKRQKDLQAIKAQVDAFQAKKQLLENKVNLIEKLKAEQKGPVHMLDEISKALPDFVWLTGMDQAAASVKFTGESNSLTAVADFISGLQRSGWFPSVDLVSSVELNNIVTFNLAATFKNPEVAAREKAEAAARAAAAQAAPPPGPAKKP
jgi:type IV pilus assembly protein PilN